MLVKSHNYGDLPNCLIELWIKKWDLINFEIDIKKYSKSCIQIEAYY